MKVTSNKRLPSSPAESGDSLKKRIVEVNGEESNSLTFDPESNLPVIEDNNSSHNKSQMEGVNGRDDNPANMEKQIGQQKAPHQVDSDKIDQILEMVSFLKNKMTDTDKIVQERCGALEKVQSELSGKVNDGLARIQINKASVESNADKVSLLMDRLTACERENERINEELMGALNKISILNSRADMKDRELVDLSTEVKDRKLVISGVPEFAKEKIFVTVVSTLNKLIKTANTEKPTQEEGSEKGIINTINRNDLINAYRVGKYKNGSKRNILVFCSTNEVKGRIMTAKALTKRVNAVYRPPTGNIDEFMKILDRTMFDTLADFGGDNLLMGDLNIDYNRKSNSQIKKLNAIVNKLAMSQYIESDTRITHNHSSKIDLIFTNTKNICCAGTLNLNISDHLPIFLVKKKERLKHQYIFVMGRAYRNLNESNYISDRPIRNIDRAFLFNDPNPNVVWSKMKKHFLKVADEHCPLRQMKVTTSKPEYISLELLELMRERDDAYRDARALKTPTAWNHARILRSRVQTQIYKARKAYVAKQITDKQGDGQKFWATIKKEFYKEET